LKFEIKIGPLSINAVFHAFLHEKRYFFYLKINKMKQVKYIFIGLMVVYILGIAVFFLKGEIAYKMVGVRPELQQTRSLTIEGNYALKEVDDIILSIGKGFFMLSLFMFSCFYIALKDELFKPIWLIKIMFRTSLFFSIFLAIAYNSSCGYWNLRLD
jgi:hypothetical protein